MSGNTGTIVRWESSINGGANWTTIVNTATTQSYTNLTQTTLFRAVVQSGVCATANSSNATITVTQIAGGTTAGSTSVCTGTNSGSVTLSGHTGTVSRWESSTNGGSTWTNITNATTTQAYTNLTLTTQYRARITSGTCIEYSTVSTITVNPVSVGGSVSSSATVCSGGNSGTLTLSGHTGSVIRWEQSINGGGSWTTITNTTTSQSYSSLTQTTLFRAVVQSGACSIANSAAATITVNQTPSLSSSLTGSVLSGDLFTYTPTSATGGTTFAWSRDVVSGISNGSASGSGGISETLLNTTGSSVDVTYVYTLTANGCQNIQNLVVTVNPPAPGGAPITGRIIALQSSSPEELAFEVKAMPNPSNSYFNLVIKSNNQSPVTVRILSVLGVLVEKHERIEANTTLRLGKEWISGTYIAEVIQSGQRKVIKIIKTN